MSSKQPVSWGAKPSRKAAATTSPIEKFVNQAKGGEAVKRLNLNIPATLHARIKAKCALDNREMTDVLTQLLERHFPESILK